MPFELYLIRTNFSRALNFANLEHKYFAHILAILQKMINLGHLILRKLIKDRLTKPYFIEWSLQIQELVLANYKEPDLTGHFDDCMKELYVQEEEMSESDEESAEVEDK